MLLTQKSIKMITKKQVINTIIDLPDEFTSDELIGRIPLVCEIQNGIQESENGQYLPHDQVVEKLLKGGKKS